MSFSKVGPGGGWSFGAKLTSAQMNQLDSDHVNALDKSVAGDVLSGQVQMASTASIRVNNAGAAIISSVNGGIQSTIGAGIKSTANTGILGTVANSITTSAPGGIAPGAIGGISDGGIPGGITTTTPGGFNLGGGPSDFPGLSSRSIARSRTIRALNGVVSPWLSNNNFNLPGMVGGGTVQWQPCGFDTGTYEGGTITSVVITFFVTNAHGGGIASMNFPAFSLVRYARTANSPPAGQTLSSADILGTGIVFASPGSLSSSAWYNGGNAQTFTYTCNQNNVLTSSFVYVLFIQDENGTGAQANSNVYSCFQTSITATTFNPA